MSKSLIATARNISHVIVDDKIETMIEAVLTVSGKEYEIYGAGILSIERAETIRINMSIGAAEVLAKDLSRWIETAKSLESKLKLENRV